MNLKNPEIKRSGFFYYLDSTNETQNTMRNVLATIIGIIIGMIAVTLFEQLLGHNLFTFPEGAKLDDMEWIKNNMDKIPIGSKIFVVIGHSAGITSSMFIAAKISKLSMIPSYICGLFFLLATIAMIIILPKELWFTISDGALAFVGFLVGTSLAKKQLSK